MGLYVDYVVDAGPREYVKFSFGRGADFSHYLYFYVPRNIRIWQFRIDDDGYRTEWKKVVAGHLARG